MIYMASYVTHMGHDVVQTCLSRGLFMLLISIKPKLEELKVKTPPCRANSQGP